MKNFKRMLGFIFLLVCVVTINIGQISSNQNFDSKQEIRTVTYNENALRKDNLYEDFDDYFVEQNDNGFKIFQKSDLIALHLMLLI